MIKRLFLILYFLTSVIFLINAGDGKPNKQFTVIFLSDYQACNCEWQSPDSSIRFIKACIPDFTSQQLSWTVRKLVIDALREQGDSIPGLCILNTGQLDISLGVPEPRVIQNIDNIRKELAARNIPLIVVAALNFTGESDYNRQLTDLNARIRTYCDSTGTGFMDPNIELSANGILNKDFVEEDYLINAAGCEKWNKMLNDYLSEYEKK